MPSITRTGKGSTIRLKVLLTGKESDSLFRAASGAVESGLPGALVEPQVEGFREEEETRSNQNWLEYTLSVEAFTDPVLKVRATLNGEGVSSYADELDEEIRDPRYQASDRKKRLVERVKLAVLKAVTDAFQTSMPPWGILVGVRPTKLVHHFYDQGFTWEEIRERMIAVYGVHPKKASLVVDTARIQRPLICPKKAGTDTPTMGVYIGIPFCPTRCSYCSFAAYPMATHGHLMEGFLASVLEEMRLLGQFVVDNGIKIESIYFGGGTPTVFDSATTSTIVESAARYFRQSETLEFTVEAGRPDTITQDKLEVLRTAGVDRISVNPQTLCDETLRVIGRDHTVDQFVHAFGMAREAGFPVINVDLIMGLPGEDLETVETTLRGIFELRPENLTVHSLAIKRAAALSRSVEDVPLPDEKMTARMMEMSIETAKTLGMHPFYLYRQRYISGDLENVGYCLPGTESIFNIQMMEERQTVLGIGGGAITKLVTPGTWRIDRIANPKCPATYARDFRQLVDSKIKALSETLLRKEL